MRLSTKKIKAEDCPNDVFVYDEENKEFIFVDVAEKEEDKTTLIFEEKVDETGLVNYEWQLDNEEEIYVVSHYKIDENIFWE